MARPSSYDPDTVPTLARQKCREGYTHEQLAAYFGIAASTWYEWLNKYPELSESIKTGRDYADAQVENSLYRRAMGYRYEERSIKVSENGDTVETTTTKEVIPDTTAQIFWLKNRKPAVWRDKHDYEHSGPGGGPIETKGTIDLTGLSVEELMQLERLVAKASGD